MSVHSLPPSFTSPHLISDFPESTPILLGYSGGADSTALLHMLSLYSKQCGAPVYAAHIHHGIRGEEADRDEAFCRSMANRLGIPLFVLHADVPALARESGESIETTARRVRYGYFDELMQTHDIPLLVTAHNANDNLETILFNLARGTGLGGLCGIPVSRLCEGGALVRPILGMTRQEILLYCEENDLSYVTDSTNVDTEYTRNYIREEIIPRLTEINSATVAHAAQLSESLRADHLCLESMAEMFLEEMRDGFSLETEKINGSPDAIVHRALRSLYREISEGGSLEYSHVIALKRLSERAIPHSSVTLPRGFEAVIEGDRLCFQPKHAPFSAESFCLPLFEGKNNISQISCEIVIGRSQNTKNIYKNSIQFSLDSAKINGTIYARNRMAGDRILLGGMHKSLKKLLCEKKIPTELRARLPILCDDNGILAIPLIGVRDGVLPKNSTESDAPVLTVQILFPENPHRLV